MCSANCGKVLRRRESRLWQIERTLNAIMTIYQVPEALRKQKIEKVLAMDYRAMGRRILKEFCDYIEKVNEEKLKSAIRQKEEHT